MGRWQWKHYRHILMENVRLEDEDKPMENEWSSSDKWEFGDESTNGNHPKADNNIVATGVESRRSSESSYTSSEDEPNPYNSMPNTAANSMASMAAVAMSAKPFGHNFSVMPHWYVADVKMEKREDDEQPLDLSAKPTSPSPINSPDNSPEMELPSFSTPLSLAKVPVLNTNRRIFKAKPRISPMVGRRTYTEEELQAALRDIQSGKLGTRRAAVIYGIPRSTLRNKVYKLAMEKERDNAPIYQSIGAEEPRTEDTDMPSDDKEELDERDDDDDEKESSATEEEKEPEKEPPKPFNVEDFLRNTSLVGTESLRALLQHGTKFMNDPNLKEKDNLLQFHPPQFSIFPPGANEIWGNLDSSTIAPYLSHLMAASRDSFNISSLLSQPNPYYNIRSHTSPAESPTEASFCPKFPAPLFPEFIQRMLMEEKLQQDEQKKREQKTEIHFPSPPRDHDDGNSSSSLMNRLSLFKPPYKNGSASESGYSNVPDYNEGRNSEESEKSATSSPPPSTTRSDSSSPLPNHKLGLNLRDAIAKSIGHKFQHEMPQSGDLEGLQRVSFSPMRGYGHDERKLMSKVPMTSTATGKGTRPKRGKYRNYDRDSLIEAVRAVQRGEMSVHRAGSFYGVPHSTLEYKVKERHLMRPRKREPKNPPEDLKRPDLQKPIATSPKPKQFPIGTPNGLKMPMFEPSFPSPFPFWPASPFQLMDYTRNPNFPANPEHLLASHFVQRMHEEARSQGVTKECEGSFLDGVIRSSLDNDQTFNEQFQRNKLLEQLYRSKYLPTSKEEDKPIFNNTLAQSLLSTVAGEGPAKHQDDKDVNYLKSGETVVGPMTEENMLSVQKKLKPESHTGMEIPKD